MPSVGVSVVLLVVVMVMVLVVVGMVRLFNLSVARQSSHGGRYVVGPVSYPRSHVKTRRLVGKAGYGRKQERGR